MNRPLRPITLENWIKKARKSTLSRNPTAPEQIISKVLGLRPEEIIKNASRIRLSSKKQLKLNNHLGRLLAGRHLSAVIGTTEFYNIKLNINSKVLAPRSESEDLVKFAIQDIPIGSKVIEIGTGSGALAISIAKARPDLNLTVTDVSYTALKLTGRNRSLNQIPRNQVTILRGSLLSPFGPEQLNNAYIIANLPYVNQNWQKINKKDLSFEPQVALYSKKNGLQAILNLLDQAKLKIKPSSSGWVLLEHDPRQLETLREACERLNFEATSIAPYCTQIKFKQDPKLRKL